MVEPVTLCVVDLPRDEELEERAIALHAAVQSAALLGDVDEADVLVEVLPHLLGRAMVSRSVVGTDVMVSR